MVAELQSSVVGCWKKKFDCRIANSRKMEQVNGNPNYVTGQYERFASEDCGEYEKGLVVTRGLVKTEGAIPFPTERKYRLGLVRT